MSSSDPIDDLYRQLPPGQSPPELDMRIRAAAADAVASESPSWRRRVPGFATAAAAVLAVGVYLQLPEEAHELAVERAPDAMATQGTAGAVEAADAPNSRSGVATDSEPNAVAPVEAEAAIAVSPAPSSTPLPAPPLEPAIDAFHADTKAEVGDAAQAALAEGLRPPAAAPALASAEVAPPSLPATALGQADAAGDADRERMAVETEVAESALAKVQATKSAPPDAGVIGAQDDGEALADDAQLEEIIVTGSKQRRGFFRRLFGRREQGVRTASDQAPDCVPGGALARRICRQKLTGQTDRVEYVIEAQAQLGCSQRYVFTGPPDLQFETGAVSPQNERTATRVLRWEIDGVPQELRCVAGEWQLEPRDASPAN